VPSSYHSEEKTRKKKEVGYGGKKNRGGERCIRKKASLLLEKECMGHKRGTWGGAKNEGHVLPGEGKNMGEKKSPREGFRRAQGRFQRLGKERGQTKGRGGGQKCWGKRGKRCAFTSGGKKNSLRRGAICMTREETGKKKPTHFIFSQKGEVLRREKHLIQQE